METGQVGNDGHGVVEDVRQSWSEAPDKPDADSPGRQPIRSGVADKQHVGRRPLTPLEKPSKDLVLLWRRTVSLDEMRHQPASFDDADQLAMRGSRHKRHRA